MQRKRGTGMNMGEAQMEVAFRKDGIEVQGEGEEVRN